MEMRPFHLNKLAISSIILLIVSMVSIAAPAWAQSGNPPKVYLPLVSRSDVPTSAPRVNASSLECNTVESYDYSIFWFGKVTPSQNYADVRLGYSNSELCIYISIFDRLTWYDDTPSAADLTNWDAVTLLLDRGGNLGNVPDIQSYRFEGQLRWWEDPADYRAAYQGSGSGWSASGVPFAADSTWVSLNVPNDNQDDRGWLITFHIPFASLGLSGAPPLGTLWGMGLVLHDRDSEAGPPLAVQTWPKSLVIDRPATWGQLVFGLPSFTPPPISQTGSMTIRQGSNGAVVKDAHVGGHSVCGEEFAPNYFNGWGDRNFAGYEQVNIQNQANLGDWPCFSKYYITLPLDSIPKGKTIISAQLTLYQFGNSSPQDAFDSLVQVLTVNEDWDESTITWNNAPYAWENVSRGGVGVLPSFPGLPGVTSEWDLSRAVSEAYQKGIPLRLVLYSADSAMHSGKYFYSSDMNDYAQTSRPMLTVNWGG
jgi:hypothetical protein